MAADDRLSAPDLGAVRAEFPMLERLAYFQTGTFGLMAESVLREVLDLIAYFEQRSWEVHGEVMGRVQEARGKLAARIGAEPGEVALTRNATDGVNLVAAGLAWKGGDEIVISDQEHPAMSYPWRWVAQRTGAVLRELESGHRVACHFAEAVAAMPFQVSGSPTPQG